MPPIVFHATLLGTVWVVWVAAAVAAAHLHLHLRLCDESIDLCLLALFSAPFAHM